MRKILKLDQTVIELTDRLLMDDAQTNKKIDKKRMVSLLESLKKKTITNQGIRKALTIIRSMLEGLKSDIPAYKTWETAVNIYQKELESNLTSDGLFYSFFLVEYISTIGVGKEPVNLSDGTTQSWQDRNTRLWN
ncbi:MAG TPA: hypothetical protein ENI73_00900 [Spirochaetes bacterium]|nr:hypothetical protein [Spirochaetota bacterium]